MNESAVGDLRRDEDLTLWKWALVAALVLVPVAARLVPYWPNFMPLTAVAIFAGAWFTDWRLKLGIPLAARLVSDAAIGFQMTGPTGVLLVYGCLVASVLLGWAIRWRRQTVLAPVAAGLTSAVVFFIVSNFGVWLASRPVHAPYYYPPTLAGLLTCYEMAWPFFRATLVGDVAYTGILFVAYAWACQLSPRWALVPGWEGHRQ